MEQLRTAISFTIPGNPVGKGRPKFSRQGGHIRTYTPEKTASYEALVRREYARQCKGIQSYPKDTALAVYICAYSAIPKSASRRKAAAMLRGEIRPTKKPDADNIAKIICDALNGLAYHDDAQIAELHIEKHYAEQPRVRVAVCPVEGAEPC